MGVEAVLGAGRAELGVVGQSKGVVHNVVAGTEAGALGQLGVAGARLQTVCISGGRRVAAEGMVKRSLAMKDGKVQSGEAGAGAEGKDQSHRLSPREQLPWSVGGRRRGRNGGVIKHIQKEKVLH